MTEHAIGVRCKRCGRTGLPPIPNSKLGSGELTHPVAHVCAPQNGTAAPCFQGVGRGVLETCVEPGILAPRIDAMKAMIWNTEALWEL